MKNVTKNLKALLALLLIAVMLAASLPALSFGMHARAAENVEMYDKLYYFTDYGNQKASIDEVVHETSIDATYEIWGGDFESKLETEVDNGFFGEIEEAYVIFDISYINWYPTLTADLYPDSTNWAPVPMPIVDALEDACRQLKRVESDDDEPSDINRIMVILGTDEHLLEGHTDFLKYVDVQINTDVLYPIFDTIVENMYQDPTNNIFYLTILLSPYFSLEDGSIDLNNEFMQCLLYYFRANDVIHDGGGNTVIITTDEGLWNAMNQPDKHWWLWEEYKEIEPAEFAGMDNLVGIGFTSYDEDDSTDSYTEWEEYMRIIHEDEGNEFPLYIYNQAGISVADWVTQGTPQNNIYYAGNGKSTLRANVPNILRILMVGGSFSYYNNWQPSACAVTYKPILLGPNGWIKGKSTISGSAERYPVDWPF